MKNFYILLGILLFSGTGLELTAQKNVAPTPEHITQANSLKETYEEDDVVILQSNEEVRFDLNKFKDLVTVNYKLEERVNEY